MLPVRPRGPERSGLRLWVACEACCDRSEVPDLGRASLARSGVIIERPPSVRRRETLAPVISGASDRSSAHLVGLRRRTDGTGVCPTARPGSLGRHCLAECWLDLRSGCG